VEELNRRLAIARSALRTLREVLGEPKTSIVRDAAIQRFEYSFETVWKASQRYLRDREGLDHPSPARVVRSCHAIGLLGEEEARLGLRMVGDRNLTVHTYNEKLAEEIYARLGSYCALMETWLEAIAAKASTP
jgi:nucleotidyltransferase substrate binding protein (TIGR01987 family)